MNNWISNQINKASWLRFLAAFVALFAYSYWAFVLPGPWSRALEAAGNLPEMVPGFPEGLAVSTYGKLEAAGLISQYVQFQLIDIPYAILNFLMLTAVIALALKRFKLGASPLRFALLLPAIYLAAEFLENPLLIILARGGGEPTALISIQQAMTSLKWIASAPALALAAISLIALVIAALIGLIRKKPA